MKNVLRLAVLLMAFFMSFVALKAQTINPDFLDGKIYIKFKDDITFNIPSKREKVSYHQIDALKGIVATYGVTNITKPFYTATCSKLQKTLAIEFSNYAMVDALIRELETNTAIEYAENAPIFKLHHTPNDPNYSTTGNRWHLDKINASTAWDITKGSASVVVAVIDNAIWTNHPDLVNKVVAKIDLADGDNNTTPPAQTAEWSHGTHTSGLVAAHTNNGIGTASIGYDVSLMGIKVGRDSDGALVAGFDGIVWAADNGADVINMSWGSAQYFQTMQNIVDYAYNKGCVLVASAGNDGNSNPTYPAALNHVVNVGSTDGNNKKSSFSQFGSFVDVMAPGGYQNDGGIIDILLNNAVYSTAYGTGSSAYMKMQGTSMSSPIVAGLCGLMLSVDSTLTPDRLVTYLKASCTNINSQNPNYIGQIGSGLVNAFAAVKMVEDSISSLVPNFKANQTWIQEGGMVNFTNLSLGSPTTFSWQFPGGSPAVSSAQNPSQIMYPTAGVYDVILTVSDGILTKTETKSMYINVEASGSSAWFQQASGFTTLYRGIDKMDIVNPDVVWATAINGAATTQTDYYTLEFTRTNDAGQTWTPGVITGIPSTYVISSISATSYTKAWVACFNSATTGDKGGVYVTSNGGQTWTKQATAVYNDAASFPNVVHFWNNNEGWAMGDPVGGYFELYNTTDGGNNWVRTPQVDIPAPLNGEYGYTGMYDVVGDTIWWGTNMGRVLISYDKGYTWSVVTVPGITDVQKVSFNNHTHGMLQQISYNQTSGALETFKVMKTVDGGLTWAAVDTAGMYRSDMCGVPGIPGMFISVGAAQGASGSSYTVNSGATWVNLDTDIQYISTEFLDGNTGWAGSFSMNATSGGVFKWRGLMSVMTSNMPVCAGDTLNVNVNVIGSLNAGNTFTVELSDANGNFSTPTVIGTVNSDVSTTVACLIPLNTAAGTAYRVRALSSNPVNTTADNGFNITINNKPSVNAGADLQVCYASAFNMNANVMYFDSLLWETSGTGTFSAVNIPNPVYSPSQPDSTAGQVELYLTAFSDCGFTKDTVFVTLLTTATADAGQDMAICEGDSIILTANGGSSYLWATDPTLCCLNIPNPVAFPATTTTYTVTATSSCGSATADVVVTVNQLPLAQISTNDPVSFCDGGNAQLLADVVSGCTYQWYADASPVQGATDTLFTAETTALYNVLVTNSNGCSQLSNNLNIYVNALPTGIVTASDTTTFCQGDSVVLTLNTSPTNTWEWYKDGALITGSVDMPLTVTEQGSYNALITDIATCSNYSIPVSITILPAPATPTITESNGTLFSSSFNGNQWYLDGSIIPGATQRPYIPTVSGDYTVQVTNSQGCKSEMSLPFYFAVGIGEYDIIYTVNIYPNPATGIIHFELPFANNSGVRAEIYDALGRLINDNLINAGEANSISVGHLSDGLYVIRLTHAGQTYYGRVVIQK